MTGFLQLVPLAVGALDLVGIILGLSLLLVMWAGWVFLALVGRVASHIPLFGSPLSSALNLISGLWKRGTLNVIRGAEHYIEHVAHMAWSLVMVIWRFFYVTGAVVYTLIRHQALMQQSLEKKISDTNAKIDFVEGLNVGRFNQDEARLTQDEQTAFDNLVAQDNWNLAMADRVAADETTIENDKTAAAVQLGQVATNLQGNINRNYTVLEQQIVNQGAAEDQNLKVTATNLQSNINTNWDNTPGVVNQIINLTVPGMIARLAPNLSPDISAIKAELDRCLDPMCDPAGNWPKKLGNQGKLLQGLEDLAIVALIIALTEAFLAHPVEVIDGMDTVLHEVADPVWNAIASLLGEL